MAVKDFFGVLMAIVVVAGVMVAVKNGSGSAAVLSNASDGFANSIKAATGQG